MLEEIRKFGLGYCDLPTLLWNVSVMLRLLTVNIYKGNTKGIPTLFYIMTIIITTSYVYVYIISTVWYSFVYCRRTNDKLSAIINFSVGVTSTIAFCKLMFMYLFANKIREIIAGYLECDSLIVPGSQFEKNILKTMRFVKKRAMIFWIVIISNGVIYMLKPVLTPGRHFPEDDFILYGLDPMFESPNYEIAIFLFSASIGLTVFLTSNITAFLIIITGYVEAQMLALGQELLHIWGDINENYNNIETFQNHKRFEGQIEDNEAVFNNLVKERLKDIAKIHTINMNLLQQVESVFRGAIAVEFILLFISITAVLLGGLENTYLEIPYSLMQVAIDCFTGQRLIDACVNFETAVYFCKWENFDTKNRQTVLLILQVSQKTLTLTAGGLSTLSFPCLMSVLNSIYSTFTTLKAAL